MAEAAKNAEPKVVSAKRQVKLEDIKYNDANKVMAILSWFFPIGLVMFFVEKEDQYVRYVGVVSTLFSLVSILISFTGIGSCIAAPLMIVVIVMGIIKITKGERLDIPVVSDLSVKIMNAM